MTLTLRPVRPEHHAALLRVAVAPEQEVFSGTVAMALETDEPGVTFHGIWQGDRAIGFFKIDAAYATRYAFAAPNGLGLRAFMIDQARQGQGLGATACRALPAYLRAAFPGHSELFLTVNLRNPGAIRAYLNGGFEDTAEIWPHGEAGPQRIMRLSLTEG